MQRVGAGLRHGNGERHGSSQRLSEREKGAGCDCCQLLSSCGCERARRAVSMETTPLRSWL